MTRSELVALIRGLSWHRVDPTANPVESTRLALLRCENGDCPILAAYHLRFPTRGVSLMNSEWAVAAKELGLPLDVAKQIVHEADFGCWAVLDGELGL